MDATALNWKIVVPPTYSQISGELLCSPFWFEQSIFLKLHLACKKISTSALCFMSVIPSSEKLNA